MTHTSRHPAETARTSSLLPVTLLLAVTLTGAFTGCPPVEPPPDEPECGNGVIEEGELCDGADVGGATCGEQGYASGTVTCSATCDAYETTGCCGDGVRGGDEACDDGNDVSGDGCESTCTWTPPVNGVRTCRIQEPLASGVCEVTAGGAAKLIVADLLMDGEIVRGGHLLLDEAGEIACTGCDCEQEAQAAAATRISCPEGVVTPGLINPHDHISYAHNPPVPDSGERYEHRHDWRLGARGHTEIPVPGYASTEQEQWHELRFVLGGATSIVGSGGPPGFLRNLDVSSNREGLSGVGEFRNQTFPLNDASGFYRYTTCDYGSNADSTGYVASRDAYLGHVGEGIDRPARNELFCVSSESYDTHAAPGGGGVSNDLLQPHSAFIHGVAFAPSDYARMAAEGTDLIWSPRSNIALYGDTARVTAAARAGVTIALGTDWLASGSMNLNRELACADEFNQAHLDGFFSDEDLWRMVTLNAARATSVDDLLGTLAVGKTGDLAIFDARERADHAAVIRGKLSDVALVLRGGAVLSGDADVVAALASGSCDTLDVCGVIKRVCVEDEVGMSLSALEAAGGAPYPAFFCDVPEDEPTCVPSRPESVEGSTVYTGEPGALDADGDGIDDGVDLCPSVFDPIRPVDEGSQADFDGDGVGDACDECPLAAGVTGGCPAVPTDDTDGDGVPDSSDLCPYEHDPAQADLDGDSKGDACDLCPAAANPGPTACPVSVYDIKQGLIPEGLESAVTGVVVTARNESGFFVQVPAGSAEYEGRDYSGVFVYGPGNEVEVGDEVSLDAVSVGDFHGQLQLSLMLDVVKTSTTIVPAPVAVAPDEVQTGGPSAAALEGVLVTVTDLRVLDDAPVLGTGDSPPSNEIVVGRPGAPGDSLRVNDYFYALDPLPPVGARFASITGVLELRNGQMKLEPRDASDVVFGPPGLVGLSLPSAFIREGSVGASTLPEPMEVILSSPAESDTFVSVTSSDASLTVVGGGVTVPTGAVSAPVVFEAAPLAEEPGPTVTLIASLDGVDEEATVRILGTTEPASLLSLTPDPALVFPSETVELTLTLDIPAPPGGAEILIDLASPATGSAPASVTVPEDALSATFEYTDLSGADNVVQATDGSVFLEADVQVGLGSRLVINEVDYDQPGTDDDEFIEIYNGTGATVDLTHLELVLVNGSSDTIYDTVSLAPAGTLADDAYLVVGAASVTVPEGTAFISISGFSVQNGGPDGIALIDTAAQELVDALSYEGSMSSVNVGLPELVSLTEGTAATAQDVGSSEGSLSRIPDGLDTNEADTDWVFTTTPTPGALNVP